MPAGEEITQPILDSLNVEQSRLENRAHLDELGGVEAFCRKLGVNPDTGLTNEQVVEMRAKFGSNDMPASPKKSYLELWLEAINDATLLVLLAAAAVAFALGMYKHPDEGWIEGSAIFIAVFLVSNITASNNYSKELQFRALEATSAQDQRIAVLRNATKELINPNDIVVGDILVLQGGDAITADSVVCDHNTVKVNESSLTGEPDDLPKCKDKDCFLLSSSVVTEADGDGVKAIAIGIGRNSQWGKIKMNLISEAVNTPLQDKLEIMTTQIGKVGIGAAFGTFCALIIRIWASDGGQNVDDGIISAFILSVTIVVVAIPEGLPLAVAISLAYSTKKMYKDQCFIRQLAACETMGNATNICSDKTGTLTENLMTVVEGWFADVTVSQEQFASKDSVPGPVKLILAEHVGVNRTAYLVHHNQEGKLLDRPIVIGNKTEGALIGMIKSWGHDYDEIKSNIFNIDRDKIYSFNSGKKRSTAVIHRPDGSIRIYCKGASEWVLNDCTMYMDAHGEVRPMTAEKKASLEATITMMAERALRTLLLAHTDFAKAEDLPSDWRENPPDDSNLCCDCIVGIIDPLRSDVKEAVAVAQRAGVIVRMVTGDNITTASAIARQCGILTPGGLSLEGPVFRKMTPRQVDEILPRLQVLARSSPEDKYLLVTRLNGYAIPSTKEEWEEKHKDKPGVSWETHKDLLLPGYKEEWNSTRPHGGHVVGVTGDGTNDAPALKAADVGLAMGISGTKVAQGAADVVILDDKFSSIVKAILWGRAVYDNIRRFLQFQLTVNIVALILVFIGAACGFGQPLTAVQMLWVNLIMDTFGALALGTEAPTRELLQRRPYLRTASLISKPMIRNIFFQSTFQLILLLVLLFKGAELFHVYYGESCFKYSASGSESWTLDNGATVTCTDFNTYCPGGDRACYESQQVSDNNGVYSDFYFNALSGFTSGCLTCLKIDYTHGTIIFNSFIFCQVFNEFTARKIFDEVNMFAGLSGNYTFAFVSIFTIGAQIFLVEVAGIFMKTSHLTPAQWLITVALGAIGLPIGVLMRFVPAREDPRVFFDTGLATSGVPGAPITAWNAETPEKERGEKDTTAKGDIESKG